MNLNKLKMAEADFLANYPDGFSHPDLQAIGKKHKMPKMIEMTQHAFSTSAFSDPQATSEAMVKIISRASMISMFEKPKFRDMMRNLDARNIKKITDSLKDFLHGDQQKGFTTFVELLAQFKLAKWSLVTILPNYYYPLDEVFVKPTTAKGIIEHFELDDIRYKPQPTWNFYHRYRTHILSMKAEVAPSLAPNNAAFCGFLMMSFNTVK